MGESTEGLEMDLPPKSGPIAVGDGLFTCNGRLARYVSNDPDRARFDLFFAWPSLGKPDIIHPAQPFPLSITISARIGVWERLKTRQPTLLRQFVETCFLLQRVGGALQTATLVVEPAPQVAERSFANLADIPLDVLGIAGNQTLAAIEAGNARQRANLLAVGRAAFGNAGLITDALGNTAGSAVAFAAPTDGGASDDDIPPAEKTVFKTTLNLRLADKSKVSDSTLYNVHVRNPGGFSRRVVPHAYYVKESWQDFSFIHATDLHISLRTDQFRKKLRQAGKDEGADRYTNPNDAFRDLIHYANHLHEIGMLDFILATGDIVDYAAEWPQNASAGADKSRLYVYDPVPGSQKNLDLFTQLVLGRSPYPDREMTKLVQEELRVPIFTTMGNHDYRLNPYPLQAKVVVDDDGFFGKAWNVLTGGVSKFVDILGDAFKGNPENLLKLAPTFLHPLLLSLIDLKITDIEQERCFNLTKGEAKVLHGGSTPKIGAFGDDAPLKSLEAKRDPILDLGESYYMLRLGPHRLVMLDTGHDAGIFSNTIDALVAYLGFASEDAVNLADGTPNSVGIDAFEIGLVRQAMLEAGNGGLVIVGLHAPPLNPKGDEYPHYFRETEHATASGTEVVGYLLRQVGPSALTDPKLLQDWQLRPDLTLKPTAFFKSGRLNTLLDWGIASRIEGKTGEFLKLCVGKGIGIARPVDLVLFGHIHHRVEYRLDWEGDADNGEMRYFMDFYSQNPKRYYRSRRAGGGDAVHVRVTNRQTVGAVERVPVAEPDPTWGRWPRIDVPRYPNPLNSAPNPAAWWLAHRPILAQTASLGLTEANDRAPEPLDVPPGPFGAPPIVEKKSRPGPSFQGFRVIFVRGNVITKMRYVNLRNLRRNDFQMPWELGADIGLEEEDFDGPDHAKLFEA